MFKIIKNGRVYSPDDLGQKDILIAHDTILKEPFDLDSVIWKGKWAGKTAKPSSMIPFSPGKTPENR